MSQLTSLLTQINTSLKAASDSITNLEAVYDGTQGTRSEVLSGLNVSSSEKVSLLSLKNESMLSYIGGLLTVLRGRVGQRDDDNNGGFNGDDMEKGRMICIEDRVVLERGVKPLEKKLEYQLSKLVRAYLRMEKEYNDAKERATRNGSESESESEEDEEEEDDDDENLAYRPNLIVSKTSGKASRSTKEEDEEEEDQEEEGDESSEDKDKETAIYKPPKIDAVLPPSQLTSHVEDRFGSRDRKDRRHVSRMQAMEEYIREQSDQPDWGTSIGANIVDHGRGGIKSLQESERERRITNYEEENFTRLNHMGMSKAERRKQKQKERAARINTIGGEDFSIFSSKRRFEDSTSRRSSKKPKTAWDRAKRKL